MFTEVFVYLEDNINKLCRENFLIKSLVKKLQRFKVEDIPTVIDAELSSLESYNFLSKLRM